MFSEKKYVGVALENDAFKVALVEVNDKGIRLLKIDRFSLVEQVGATKDVFSGAGAYMQDAGEQEEEVFGFAEEGGSSNGNEQAEQKEVDFKELEAHASEPEIFSIGDMDSNSKAQNNIVLLYNILNDISRKNIRIGTNITAGNTVYQIFTDTDYSDIKEKQLVESLEDKLQAIYGEQKSADNYAYEVREDGSLIMASVDESPAMLDMLDETKSFYRGNLHVEEVYSDEVALAGLFRSNYDPEPGDITALLQFGNTSCHVVFMEGTEIYRITSPISIGTGNHDFLNVVFSKILFQLDSGEIPELDRIVIANNSLGENAVKFFRKNFSDSTVEEFEYTDDFLDKGKFEESALGPFTTAIALATAAVKKDDNFPPLALTPAYIRERQQIFKLKWHGMLLLFFIFATLPATNYFYQQNVQKIESLSSEIEQTGSQIEQLVPIVNQTNEASQNLTLLVSKLAVLDSLSSGSKAWSAKIDILNTQMNNIPNSWFTSMAQTQDGAFIEGYTLYRNRIPAIVDVFAEATLLNVNTKLVREKELHKFSMIVQEFSEDPSIYSPEKPTSIQQILNN